MRHADALLIGLEEDDLNPDVNVIYSQRDVARSKPWRDLRLTLKKVPARDRIQRPGPTPIREDDP